MSDDLGIFQSTEKRGRPTSQRRVRQQRIRPRRRGVFLAALIVLALTVGAVGYGVRELIAPQQVPDYEGAGGAEVVVQIKEGESLSAIGDTLLGRGVVASVRAFTLAAEDDRRTRGVQPGYYQVREQMSGSAAVSALLDPASRVGRLEIRGGEQLDDVQLPNGAVVPGLLTELSRASCATIRGQSTCVRPDQLRAAMSQSDPATLGVPNWVAEPMSRVEPGRRLEGLLVPGTYDVRPGSSARELLGQLTEISVTRLLAGELPDSAAGTGYSPYEVLVIASIIEREAITPDFGKVSRVIYNRLAAGIPLQMDSTINYPLDRQQVRTTGADRARPGPYNTYLNKGLPPSPIGAPSAAAVQAAANPDAGPWRYFVKCQRDGSSCFSVTIEEHNGAVRDAVARGVF
ncbi:MAG: endolytic transglycosylase MltG [Actinobacteria bacterium]|nr:endolytic transglycosylase MltG [Actinomycetota bacterium]